MLAQVDERVQLEEQHSRLLQRFRKTTLRYGQREGEGACVRMDGMSVSQATAFSTYQFLTPPSSTNTSPLSSRLQELEDWARAAAADDILGPFYPHIYASTLLGKDRIG